MQAARDLYPPRSYRNESSESKAVGNAWYAVGVGKKVIDIDNRARWLLYIKKLLKKPLWIDRIKKIFIKSPKDL
jgi:hypothetical protein